MRITPRGTSIQELYRWYRDSLLLVNRRYQRKLVWTLEEKASLIDSILRGYPIPLFLLAEDKAETQTRYEIIDGMQRLNAIFTFIETNYSFNGKYFDLEEFSRARQAAEEGLFTRIDPSLTTLDKKMCADFLDYQLAVTVFPGSSEEDITGVFGRINSSGRQLSNQEKRQAGIVTPFADLVRRLASELRGDVSDDLLNLSQMPTISIESKKTIQGYGISAENTFWCRHGILSSKQLRESDDEDLIADIAASVLLKFPFPRSKELLDQLYLSTEGVGQNVENALTVYGSQKLASDLKGVFSIIDSTVQSVDNSPNKLRKTVTGGSSVASIKTPFYALFMAFFDLVVHEQKSPYNSNDILKALQKISDKLATGRHYITRDDREKNINMTKGLIQDFFINKEPPDLGHGTGLVIDFENSLRRSKIENSRYEMKQGLLRLDHRRDVDPDIINSLAETFCGIANLGPKSTGYVHLGVADKKQDADRIQTLDSVEPIDVSGRFVVGIDREAILRQGNLDSYINWITEQIRNTKLSDPLKTDILGKLDPINYKGLSVLRIQIPSQESASYVGEKCFTREGSQTIEVAGPKIEAIIKRFSNS